MVIHRKESTLVGDIYIYMYIYIGFKCTCCIATMKGEMVGEINGENIQCFLMK